MHFAREFAPEISKCVEVSLIKEYTMTWKQWLWAEMLQVHKRERERLTTGSYCGTETQAEKERPKLCCAVPERERKFYIPQRRCRLERKAKDLLVAFPLIPPKVLPKLQRAPCDQKYRHFLNLIPSCL